MLRPAVVLLMVACGGSPGSSGSAGTGPCSSIVVRYVTALADASACDPMAQAPPCVAHRPISMSSGVVGLCNDPGSGYVNAVGASELDQLLHEYSQAGCSLGSCPQTPAHTPVCVANGYGPGTCH
jgi:hypothetical protein